ncbi:hypothetical protein HOLDEFILI_00290 [Holdemania filiformis DSM 12042]|uniref:Uncharacterized protein n=1 Tax=Holdemania filiformis DSM 12042 TaxID=545696 RepID=B9Y3B5_9FIRM|nr:hypothetical protein HOLDEFILI_00290 [Holdemania filiformis DSM 12042]
MSKNSRFNFHILSTILYSINRMISLFFMIFLWIAFYPSSNN